MNKIKVAVAIVIGSIAIGSAVYYKTRNHALEQILFILDQTQKTDYVKNNVDSYGLDYKLSVKIWESFSHMYAKELLNEFGLKDALLALSVDEDSLEPVIRHKLHWIAEKTIRKYPYDDFLTIKMLIDLKCCKEFSDMAKSSGLTNDAAVIERMWKKVSLSMTEAAINEFGGKQTIRILMADPNDPNEMNGRDRIKMLKMFGNIASQSLNERSNVPVSSHK